MKTWMVLGFCFFAFFSEARTFTDVGAEYDFKVNADLEAAHRLERQMRQGVRSGCPSLNSPDMSSCFKEQLAKIEIRSAAQLAVLIKAGVNASLFDHTRGYDIDMVRVFMADNMLSAFEQVQLPKFYATDLEPSGFRNKKGLKLLRQNEEGALYRLLSEALPLMKINSAEGPRAPAALARWRSRTALGIEQRRAVLKKRKFQFDPL
jgi:hypothetical protein